MRSGVSNNAMASLVGLMMLGAGGCAPEGGGERVEVRAGKWVNRDGTRSISYQAMHTDGAVTYIDFEPFGSVDLITAERESVNDGSLLRLVRDGFDYGKSMPADGPSPTPITSEWNERFAALSARVDLESIPWSAEGHEMTPSGGGTGLGFGSGSVEGGSGGG